jgi:predicted Zn-dependent protease with MMP-like domain
MEMQDYPQLDNLFEQKRESVLFQIQEATQKSIKEMIDTEMDLFEFELFNAVAISEEQSKKTTEEVRKIRKQRWQEALKKSNNNKEEALQDF